MILLPSAAAVSGAAAAAAAAGAVAAVASSPAAPEHTCNCAACMQMTHSLFFPFLAKFVVVGVIVMLLIVGGLFLWGWLFKKFKLWY